MVNKKAFAVIVFIAVALVVFGLGSISGESQGASRVVASAPEPHSPASVDPLSPSNVDSLPPSSVDPQPALRDDPLPLLADETLRPASVDPRPPSGIDPNGDQVVVLEHLPLMMRWSNWRPEFGPAFVYAREADINGMLQLDAPVDKMIMTTSYEEVERMMSYADELKAAGVTTIGLNTENGSGMTPGNQMQTLDSDDPEVNVVARVAGLATSNGFKVLWGPVRSMTDQVSDRAILVMMASGVSGLAIQEQKFIETQPASSRLAAVDRTRERYLALAKRAGLDDFSFHVQIMQERCPNLDNCVAFVEGLEAIPVDTIAIWSNGPIPIDFVNAIRMQPNNTDALLRSRQ